MLRDASFKETEKLLHTETKYPGRESHQDPVFLGSYNGFCQDPSRITHKQREPDGILLGSKVDRILQRILSGRQSL